MIDEQLVNRYLPMVRWHLKYYGPDEREDVLQEGTLAILEELQNDAPEPAARVRRAINRRLRKLSRHQENQRDHEVHPTREDGSSIIEDTATTGDNCQSVVGDCWVEWMIGQLHGRQRECSELYFREGLTQMEIGTRLGMPQQNVSQAIHGAIKNMRKLLP